MSPTLPRLILTGPESTGKTVLAAALSEALGGIRVEEYLRHYFQKMDREGRNLTLADALPIAQGQWQWEEEGAAIARTLNKPLICDTDLVSSLVYNRHYYGDQKNSPLWQDWQTWAKCQQGKLGGEPYAPRLYLLCAIDWPWVDDGQRDAPHLRQYFFELFRQTLDELALPYRILEGSLQERQEAVTEFLRR